MMKRYPQTIGPGETVGTAAQTLLWHRIRHLPVTADDGRLVGVVSNRDVAWYMARVGPGASRHPVREAMSASPQTAGPDISLTEAAARMASDRIGCLPITEQGYLLSLVTTTDVLGAQVAEAMDATPRVGPTAADVMTRDPATTQPTANIIDAALILDMERVRHLPVIDDDGTLVGILSDRDISVIVATVVGDHAGESAFAAFADVEVGDVMTRDVVTARPEQSLEQLAAQLAVIEVGAMPVVAPDNRLLGIVSVVDVLRGLAH